MTARETFQTQFTILFHGDDQTKTHAIWELAGACYDAGTFTPADASVTMAKMAAMAADTVLGNLTGSSTTPTAVTVAALNTYLDALAHKANVVIATDNVTLDATKSGFVYGIGTDAKTFTLPATAAGLKYTFVNTGAAGNNIITIAPQAADGISGTIKLAASVVVDAGVVSKKLINTKATSQAGDSVTLIGTGVTGTTAWIILSSSGIWAPEA